MKKFSLIFLSFFAFIINVNAYYIVPNTFDLTYSGNTEYDYYGVNNGDVSSVYSLNGNSNKNYHFVLNLDGSNCLSNLDYTNCRNTIESIENGSNSKTQYGYFTMCVSKPQIRWEISWASCNQNCLKKSNDLVIINNSYQNCTLGLYDTETGTNMTDEGYLVRVYFNIAKWQFDAGAYSGLVNGTIKLYNESESTLYYRYINDVMLSDEVLSSLDSGYGIFNHDPDVPDVGGETFLNNGTCVKSYNLMNNYTKATWNRDTETLTLNNTLTATRNFDEKNLVDLDYTFGINDSNPGTIQWNFLMSPLIPVTNGNYCISEYYNGNLYIGNTYGYAYVYTYDSNQNLISNIDFINNLNNNKICKNLNDNNVKYFRVYVGVDNYSIGDNIKIQLEKGNKVTSFSPYYGYTTSYDNIGGDFDIFKWYDTNLNTNGLVQIRLTSYTGRTRYFDLVNCSNSRVCRFENELYFPGSITSLFNKDEQRIKKIELQVLSNTQSIYFKNPYIYNINDVPNGTLWESYYQPANTFICSDNDNGTYYNALNKKVYFNPDNPPKKFESNVNSDYQNIFGNSINFYGLTDIFSFPINLINNINNGNYRQCSPLVIPFPGFPNKNLTIPCFSTFLWNRFPSLKELYNEIIIGILSMKVTVGTINYIKRWYQGKVESEDLEL